MSPNLFRSRDWWIIGPLAAAALVLGFYGLMERDGWHWQAAPIEVIRTFGLIRGGFFDKPFALVVAQTALPLLALFGAAKLLLESLRRDMRVALARRARNHVIVCGLGDTGAAILHGLHAAGRHLVALTMDGTTPNALACEKLGVAVLNGDGTKPKLLELAGIAKSDALIIATGSDAKNLEVGLCAEALIARAGRRAKLVVEIRSDWLRDRLIGHRRATLGTAGVEFRLFNTAIDAARLAMRHPAFHLARRDARAPRLVLAGFGAVNRECARRAICSNFALPGLRPQIAVFDRQADLCKDAFTTLYPAAQELADVMFAQADFAPDNPRPWADLRRRLEPVRPDVVVIALGADEDSLHAALSFRASLDKMDLLDVPVFVRLKEQRKLGSMMGEMERQALLPHRLIAFGGLDVLTSPAMLVGDELDRLARAFHEIYRETLAQGLGDKPADVPWERLAEYYKESSRAQADHLAIALQAVGYRIVAGAGKAALSDAAVENLARIAHARWMIERRMGGWSGDGERDGAALRNRILREWHELDAPTQEWNRTMAQRIPDVLARIGAGVVAETSLDAAEFARATRPRSDMTKSDTGSNASARPGASSKSDRTVRSDAQPDAITVLRVDPMNDADLVIAAKAIASRPAGTEGASPAMRVRLAWCGGENLARVERLLAAHAVPLAAIDGWERPPSL